MGSRGLLFRYAGAGNRTRASHRRCQGAVSARQPAAFLVFDLARSRYRFRPGGVELQTTDGPGEVGHTAADRPLFTGLRRGALNLVLTDSLPLYWDNARSLAGVTTLDRGYHLCLIALRYAHGDRVPFLSVNTCVHEILHALLLDIFLTRPSAYQAAEREYRIDWYATRLWLLHDGAAVRRSAQAYLDRLRAAS